MPLDAEGADSGDAPEEEAEDVSQVSGDHCVPPPLLRHSAGTSCRYKQLVGLSGISCSAQATAGNHSVTLLTSGLIFMFASTSWGSYHGILDGAEREGFQGSSLGHLYSYLSLDQMGVGADMKSHPQQNIKYFRKKKKKGVENIYQYDPNLKA